VFAAAVAICLPMVPGVLNGNITAVTAGTRLLVAIVICWVGGSILTSIIDRYSVESRRANVIKMLANAKRNPSTEPGGAGQAGSSTEAER